MVMAVSEIVNELIKASTEGKSVNLNAYVCMCTSMAACTTHSYMRRPFVRALDKWRAINCLITKCMHFSRLKSAISSKYGVTSQPRLIDIIAAVPHTHRKVCCMFVCLLFFFSFLVSF